MTNRSFRWTSLIPCICLFILILDTKTAIAGAAEGIKLCLSVVIPSLFPFFIITSMLNSQLIGTKVPIIGGLTRYIGIPNGAESVFLLGLLGGYPVGAQSINEACCAKAISKEYGSRMLAFCNNAGPAFIFGIGATLFPLPIVWSVWGIQIISSICVGLIISEKNNETVVLSNHNRITITQSLEKSIRIMASICGWILLFRVILNFFTRWFLWFFPAEIQILISGFTELSNGSVALINIQSLGLRYIFFNIMLSFGGLCVTMQTASAAKRIGMKNYFPGKLLQTCIVLLLSYFVQFFTFPSKDRYSCAAIFLPIILFSTLTVIILLKKCKKTVAFPKNMLYNT